MTPIEWNVIIYDKPGADRSTYRPIHLEKFPEAVNNGIVTFGGALYHDTDKSKFAGSVLHIIASSKEEVIDFLKKDIYYQKGIWDIESVIVHPMGVACRLPKKMNGVTVDYSKP